MFLQKIEMKGFKSFADKVVIDFDQPVTGIVGPNGCGKSNITDAIRWVLGEQSAKSLRGSSMSDVIFSGTKTRSTVNVAEVTLVFNNEQHYLNTDYQQVELTRKIHRQTGEGEYYINKTKVRLKDVHELIMDTGIGQDSLSMISQGNISEFAEARPIDRRALFEEAAGVSKYKKRKETSLNKLGRTQENLDRVEDILIELERQVKPLERQAKKTMKYRSLQSELKDLEVAVLVEGITFFNEKLQELEKELASLDTEHSISETSLNVHEVANEENKEKLRKLDRDIDLLQQHIVDTIQEIQTLESRKIEIDEQRKYRIEAGDNEIRQNELKSMLAEAKFEYEDRKSRHERLSADMQFLNEELSKLNGNLIEEKEAIEVVRSKLRRANQRIDVLKAMLEQPYRQHQGVRSIKQAQSSLPGVLDVVADAIQPLDGYEEAISTALGGMMYHIITENPDSARQAVNFLKQNRSGRATFLPLTVVYERFIKRADYIVCENTEGFLGSADQFVNCDPKYNVLVKSLLGNVLVSDTLKNAQELAELLKNSYKIVTLDGEVIHRGGSITGGTIKDSYSPLTLQKELTDLENSKNGLQELELKYQNKIEDINRGRDRTANEIMNKRINHAQLTPVLDAKRAKYERLLSEYESTKPKDQELSETFEDDLVKKLNDLYLERDEKTVEISSLREQRVTIQKEIEGREKQIRQIRDEHSGVLERVNDIKVNIARVETRLENDLERLTSEYKMTYEYAFEHHRNDELAQQRDEVNELRTAIEKLGNINMSAPEEYAEVKERFDFMNHQYDDLVASRDHLLDAINEMNDVMEEQFSDMFYKINDELQDVFAKLFGGGTATLIMEDPDDILNTGIDIDVQPPGKSVQNIRLFSGGEKALIAISVLFSILKARPVPLCIFDEVEAALDQANVERFANYIRDFSDDTQFVVVTHRPGTMEKCDVLYGVTMPEHGVSQMLKVELKEAVEQIGDEA